MLSIARGRADARLSPRAAREERSGGAREKGQREESGREEAETDSSRGQDRSGKRKRGGRAPERHRTLWGGPPGRACAASVGRDCRDKRAQAACPSRAFCGTGTRQAGGHLHKARGSMAIPCIRGASLARLCAVRHLSPAAESVRASLGALPWRPDEGNGLELARGSGE